jgi:hypothetical protein
MAYGLEIRNSSGTITLTSGTGRINIINNGSTSATTGGSGPAYEGFTPYISFPGMTVSNTDEYDVAITTPTIDSNVTPGLNSILESTTVERDTDQFRIKYTSTINAKTFTFKYFCFRY